MGKVPPRGKVPPSEGTHRRLSIPDDERGIAYEIDRMVDYVDHFSGDPPFIDLARQIVRYCPSRNQKCEVKALYEWVCAKTRFIQDPYDKEVLSTPARMLGEIARTGMAHGDCDDLSTFLSTFIANIGVEPRFRFGGNKEQGIHHVWVQAEINGNWVDLDPSLCFAMGKYHTFQIYDVRQIFD